MSVVEFRSAKPLVFTNSDAIPKVTTIFCDRASVPGVMAWYGAYYSGDRYSVTFDGNTVNKDQNGEMLP